MDKSLKQQIILVGIEKNDFEYEINELTELAKANNFEVVTIFSQKIDRPNPGTYFGSGKLEEIATYIFENEIDLVVANDELNASQIRNIEKITKVNVIDRTQLILDIFAQRAQSKLSILQVQIAQLNYQLPRLRTSVNLRLDQQGGTGGGSFTSRGSGETKLEQSRRVIQSRISKLKEEIKHLQKNEEIKAKTRRKNKIPTVALVGYTNAGKSTIMNQFIEHFGQLDLNEDKKVFEKNMLFATLNTTVRQMKFNKSQLFLLSDTVGFVSRLPHDLVEAFQTTLQEAKNADLLLHVVDISSNNAQEMMQTTIATLKEIGVVNIPIITVLNKADQTEMKFPTRVGDELTISSIQEKSVDLLADQIKTKIFGNQVKTKLFFSFNQQSKLSLLQETHDVFDQEYSEQGTLVSVLLNEEEKNQYSQFIQ